MPPAPKRENSRKTDAKGSLKSSRRSTKSKRLQTKRCNGASLECIINRMKQEHPKIHSRKTREMVKIALVKGLERGVIAQRAGKWCLADPRAIAYVTPDGKLLMTVSLLNEYRAHMRDAHDRARRKLAEHFEDVASFINANNQRRDSSEDRNVTDVLAKSMLNTLIQKYCYSRQVVREKSIRHLARYLQEVAEAPSFINGNPGKKKSGASVQRRDMYYDRR